MAELAKDANRPKLVRGILRWDLLALVINGIIGAGIFGLPSKVYALIGTHSLIAFLICAGVVALIVLCFAEVASRYERTGGSYLYAREALGPLVGFQAGWMAWLARVTSFAALSNLLVSYLDVLVPGAGSAVWRPVVICLVMVGLTVINLVGVRNSVLVTNALTIGKLVPLALLIVAGLWVVQPERLALGPAPSVGALSDAVLLLIFAFTGFEASVIPSGEMKDPRRDLPWALLVALAVVAAIYILVQVVCIGTVPELGSSERPLADAGARALGAAGRTFLAAGALVSITGVLNGIALVSPRLLFAMAEEGQLPRALMITHRRFHTPWVAILVSSGIALALSLSGSFLGALTISTVIRLLTYMVTCAAMIVLRRRADAPPAMFLVPAGLPLAVLTLVLCIWLLAHSGGREARDVTVAAVLGFAVYFGARAMRPKASAAPA